MSDDPKFEYVRGLLEVLEARFKDVKPRSNKGKGEAGSLVRVTTSLSELQGQFERDWKKLQDSATSKAEREQIEKRIEGLAKALPGVAKGTLSAISAFKKGDAISGTAAVMDICAAVAPIVGTISAAAGPPGMLVGAIFSLVGQILSFFAPEAEPLTAKIEKLLRDLEAEKTQREIVTVRQGISIYTASLKSAASRAAKHLDEPTLSLMVTSEVVKALNPLEGGITKDFRTVMNWLSASNNQSLELWPMILNAACQAWADMLAATLTLLSLVNSRELQKHYDRAATLKPVDRAPLESALRELQAAVISRLVLLQAQNQQLLETLQSLVPAARDRGMFWHISDDRVGSLHAGTNLSKGDFAALGGEQRKLSVVVPTKDQDDPRPTYYLLHLEKWASRGYDRTYITEVKPSYKQASSQPLKGADEANFHLLSDVWAVPREEGRVVFYTAKDKQIRQYLIDVAKSMNDTHRTNAGFSWELNANIGSVRAIEHPEWLLDDPDNTGTDLNDIRHIICAGLVRENGSLFVTCGREDNDGKYVQSASGYVPSPWAGYDGIGIDQRYVWVFGPSAFACATHASVIRCLKEREKNPNARPRWMVSDMTGFLHIGNQNPNPKPLDRPFQGLIDLSPCDDGTVVAALYRRSVKGGMIFVLNGPSTFVNEYVDENGLYSGAYETDLKAGTISVAWTQLAGRGIRVQKSAVFCWPLFERLSGMIRALNDELAAV